MGIGGRGQQSCRLVLKKKVLIKPQARDVYSTTNLIEPAFFLRYEIEKRLRAVYYKSVIGKQ